MLVAEQKLLVCNPTGYDKGKNVLRGKEGAFASDGKFWRAF